MSSSTHPAAAPPQTLLTGGDWGLLGLITVLWGGAFALTGHAVDHLPPAGVVMTRMWVGAGLVAAWTALRGHDLSVMIPGRGKDVAHLWTWFFALGFTGAAAPFFLISVGQLTVSSSVAGILMAATPLTVIALAHIFVAGERLTPRKAAGFFIGFAGVVILFGPAALGDLGGPAITAQALILAGAMSYAVNAILIKRSPNVPPEVGATGLLVAAAIITTPFGIHAFAAADTSGAPASSFIATVVLGAGATGAASIIYMRLIQNAGPSFVALSNYLVPVTAAFIGMALGEAVRISAFVALMVILIGVFVGVRAPKPVK